MKECWIGKKKASLGVAAQRRDGWLIVSGGNDSEVGEASQVVVSEVNRIVETPKKTPGLRRWRCRGEEVV